MRGPQLEHTGGNSVGHKGASENTGRLEKGVDQNLMMVQRSKEKNFLLSQEAPAEKCRVGAGCHGSRHTGRDCGCRKNPAGH